MYYCYTYDLYTLYGIHKVQTKYKNEVRKNAILLCDGYIIFRILYAEYSVILYLYLRAYNEHITTYKYITYVL